MIRFGLTKERERVCGRCTACCIHLDITESPGWPRPTKPAHVPCGDLIQIGKRSGCRVHGDRPQVCSYFTCVWLADNRVPENLRPDRSGLLIFPSGGMIMIQETKPGAFLAFAVRTEEAGALETYIRSIKTVLAQGKEVPVEELGIQPYAARRSVKMPRRAFSFGGVSRLWTTVMEKATKEMEEIT